MTTITTQTTAEKSLEVLTANMPAETVAKMKVVNASKVYSDEESFYKSEELRNLWSGYQGLKSHVNLYRTRTTFIRAYIVSVDPAKNYGRDYQIFTHYKDSEGLLHIQEESISSMLSNSPFQIVLPFEDSFLLTGDYCDKSNHNRRILKSRNSTVA